MEEIKMTRYYIHIDNMGRVESKLKRIQNKCEKYGYTFSYNTYPTIIRKVKNESGQYINTEFVPIEVEGNTKINGYELIAKIEHTENGNIIKKTDNAYDIEIPEEYYTRKPVCEHCGSNRMRKVTYLVLNTETQELKQIGKSCLADYTHGLSAEYVAQYYNLMDVLEEGEVPEKGCKPYFETKEILCHALETVRIFGYQKTSEAENEADTTKFKTYILFQWYCMKSGTNIFRNIIEHAKSKEYNPESESVKEKADQVLKWITEQNDDNNYIHNLKVVCVSNYIEYKNFGFLVSLIPTHERAVKALEEKKAQQQENNKSEHFGEIGKRVSINIVSVKILTGWETQWGYTKIVEFKDTKGNTFIRKTSKYIPDKVNNITGTIKAHNVYKGIKQTELTRCKLS